jgi:hypothetical protein
MSGAVAAHAAYNGSGTQGLAVTNKIPPPHSDEDVMSVFWNKNDTTRQLLFGSSVLEIPTSGGSQTSFGGSQIFTVNNDIDCLGDMYAEVTLSAGGGAAGMSATGAINNFGLAYIIDRLEFQVGTQIWQTLERTDLLALCSTELTEGAFERFAQQANGFVTSSGSHLLVAGTGLLYGGAKVVGGGPKLTAYVPLPMLTKTLGPQLEKFADQTEDGYPMAAAPHQSVKIKMTYGKQADIIQNAAAGLVDVKIDVKLYAQHIIMCNEERQQMKAMPQGLPKRLKMSQNSSTVANDHAAGTIQTIDLDHFSLYASHLIISVDSSESMQDVGLVQAELKLNSSSFSGVLKGPLLEGPAIESMGLYNNQFFLNGTPNPVGIGYYVFPLAARAFGGSSVPLNRFDNIRLSLSFSKVLSKEKNIVVTCVGETTALFKGGAASLAMY